MRNEYDPYSAVTFLLLGLGIGAVVTIICSPQLRQRGGFEKVGSRRGSWLQPQREQNHRVA
jgi:hypothetical protein